MIKVEPFFFVPFVLDCFLCYQKGMVAPTALPEMTFPAWIPSMKSKDIANSAISLVAKMVEMVLVAVLESMEKQLLFYSGWMLI